MKPSNDPMIKIRLQPEFRHLEKLPHVKKWLDEVTEIMNDDAVLDAIVMGMDGSALDRLTRAVCGAEPVQPEETVGIGAATEWRFN